MIILLDDEPIPNLSDEWLGNSNRPSGLNVLYYSLQRSE
jgi:hypothetical protein